MTNTHRQVECKVMTGKALYSYNSYVISYSYELVGRARMAETSQKQSQPPTEACTNIAWALDQARRMEPQLGDFLVTASCNLN